MELTDLLRVPFLFIMDQIFKMSFGFYDFDDLMTNLSNAPKDGYYIHFYNSFFPFFIKTMVFFSIFGLSVCLFFLPTRYLNLVYLHSVSVCVVLFSYWTNKLTLNFLLDENFKTAIMNGVATLDVDIIKHHFKELQTVNVLYLLFFNILLQIFLSRVFDFLQAYTSNHSNHKVFYLGCIMSTIMALIPSMHEISITVTVLSTFLPFFIIILKTLWLNIYSIISIINRGITFLKVTANNHELNYFIANQWIHLKISSILRIFWAIRVLEQIAYLLIHEEMKNEPLFVVVKYLLIRGCDTFTAVVGMTSFVSFFCYVIGDFFRTILMTSDDETMSIENLSATLFYILAVLTGLTLIEPEERFMGLYRIFFLIFGLLVSFIHNMASPLLLSMGISYNSSLHRHLRPLFVSGFLLMVSFFTLMYLWYSNLMSNWLIVVSSLNIQNIIQIFVTLNVYSLLIIDHSIPFEEKLDDYVFYIQSFGCAVTFCFGVVFFLHGIYNTIYIPDSLAHAPMIFLDTYLVVWCGIKKGWKIFIRRRLATLKIESLADATIDQTLLINNHCPICFQIMKSAKITNCNHYYHGRCLRKWLYIKDYCPMCHTIVSGHKNQTPTTD